MTRADRIATLVNSAAARPHGTRARYVSGCRCLSCRAANSRYARGREQARRDGDTRHIVPAAAARRHIVRLGKLGMGYKIVAECAKLGHSIVFEVRRGRRLQIRASSERAILAVRPELGAYGDAALIGAAATWRLIEDLLDRGYTKKQLAAWLGVKRNPPALQIKRGKITAGTALKVKRLYEKINQGLMRREK